MPISAPAISSLPPGLPLDWDPARSALFLDFDGTLVEIAPTPASVAIPPRLPDLLARLAERLEGAVAVVSGRTLAELDHYLPIPVAKAAEHGAAIRMLPGVPVEATGLPAPPGSWFERALAFVADRPGMLVERKEHGLVLHYRNLPEAGPEAAALAAALAAERPGAFTVLPAHMAHEIKPMAVSKGTAVATLLGRAPFAGRQPLFVGDDVTDEAGMAAARAAGGFGLRLQDAFGTPVAFRDWLGQVEAALAGRGA